MSATFTAPRALVTRGTTARLQPPRSLGSRSSTFVATAFAASPSASRRCRCRAARLQVVAYRESDQIGDWRVKQMVDLAHTYFAELITKGRLEVAEQILDDSVVHKDIVWDAAHPIAGIKGMKAYVSALRSAYPDFWVEIDQIGTCDVNSIFVTYNGSATNLGEYHSHKPSRHTSNFQGCNLIKFNDDRSRITEVLVYRSAFAEDKLELGEKELDNGSFREIRLRRLI